MSGGARSRKGIFSIWQPRYAVHKIATFPVTAEKRPATKGYLRTGIHGSTELAEKFVDADAFGFPCGTSSNITLIDIDTKDEKVLADALATYGETPVISRTPSGGHHAWYRHSGERRRIRPLRDLPIDILGGGYAVAPPSQVARGTYEFIQGGLDDLNRLPTLRSTAVAPAVITTADTPVAWREMRTGDGRNNELFRYCLAAAPDCRTLEQLIDQAKAANQHFKEPIMDLIEIEKSARQAWKYQLEDRNFLVRPRVQLAHDIVDAVAASFPDAIALLAILERYHAGNDTFVLANSMADKLGWTLPRFRNARDHLQAKGLIRCVHRGGRGPHDPSIYAWPTIQGVRFHTPI
jgi:Bifunctional DNA primase/polymerase, N-terminal